MPSKVWVTIVEPWPIVNTRMFFKNKLCDPININDNEYRYVIMKC